MFVEKGNGKSSVKKNAEKKVDELFWWNRLKKILKKHSKKQKKFFNFFRKVSGNKLKQKFMIFFIKK